MSSKADKWAVAVRALAEGVKRSIVDVSAGSTVAHFDEGLCAIRDRVEGLVSSSECSAEALDAAGIRGLDLNATRDLPLYAHCADECAAHKRLIEVGGAALPREKIVAASSHRLACVIEPVSVGLYAQHAADIAIRGDQLV